MFIPDADCEGRNNSLYEARRAKNIGLSDAARMTDMPRSTFKAYERGLARPGKYWDILERTFGPEAMTSFYIDTSTPEYSTYRLLLERNYAANTAASGIAPRTLEEWRKYLGYQPKHMCALFNITYLTYRKWRNGDMPRYQYELVKRLFGDVKWEPARTPAPDNDY